MVGSVITEECRTRGRIPVSGTVVTRGGALSCRHVLHVVAPDDLQECQRAVQVDIQSAVAKQSSTLYHFRDSANGLMRKRAPTRFGGRLHCGHSGRRSQRKQHREPRSRATCGLQ